MTLTEEMENQEAEYYLQASVLKSGYVTLGWEINARKKMNKFKKNIILF